MFDVEKKLKEIVMSYGPALKDVYKKEMKKLFILDHVEVKTDWCDKAFKERVEFLSKKYDELDKRIDSLL